MWLLLQEACKALDHHPKTLVLNRTYSLAVFFLAVFFFFANNYAFTQKIPKIIHFSSVLNSRIMASLLRTWRIFSRLLSRSASSDFQKKLNRYLGCYKTGHVVGWSPGRRHPPCSKLRSGVPALAFFVTAKTQTRRAVHMRTAELKERTTHGQSMINKWSINSLSCP